MKTGLFIDVSNLYHCVGKKFNGKIDYSKYLAEIAPLSMAKAYGTKIDSEAINFVKRLNSIGFSTKFVRTTPKDKTSVSINMAIDIVKNLDTLDEVILGSSSREMIPLIEFLKENSVKVIVYACGICHEVRNICETHELEENILETSNR